MLLHSTVRISYLAQSLPLSYLAGRTHVTVWQPSFDHWHRHRHRWRDQLKGAEYAELGKKVVMIGQGKKFELWDEERWNKCRNEWVSDKTDGELPAALAELTL